MVQVILIRRFLITAFILARDTELIGLLKHYFVPMIMKIAVVEITDIIIITMMKNRIRYRMNSSKN